MESEVACWFSLLSYLPLFTLQNYFSTSVLPYVTFCLFCGGNKHTGEHVRRAGHMTVRSHEHVSGIIML